MTKSLQDTTKLKYAIYTRVSTDEQENENQLIKIRQYANKNNLIYDIYKEIESSSNNRPIKNKIIKYIQQGKYQGLIVYKLDRWGRSYSELINDEKIIIEYKIDFISVTENINLKTSHYGIIHNILTNSNNFIENGIFCDRSLAKHLTHEQLNDILNHIYFILSVIFSLKYIKEILT